MLLRYNVTVSEHRLLLFTIKKVFSPNAHVVKKNKTQNKEHKSVSIVHNQQYLTHRARYSNKDTRQDLPFLKTRKLSNKAHSLNADLVMIVYLLLQVISFKATSSYNSIIPENFTFLYMNMQKTKNQGSD